MSAITPCLWFDDDLEEAMEFYAKIFPDSSIGSVSRYGEAGPGEPGTVMAGDWTLTAWASAASTAGPMHAGFTEAISFSVACADQGEVDYYWDNLVAGGERASARWLKDRFGLSWQIVPDRLVRAARRPGPRPRAAPRPRRCSACSKIVVADVEAAAEPPRGRRDRDSALRTGPVPDCAVRGLNRELRDDTEGAPR